MMRVGVFSDTHGSLINLPRALERMGKIDAFLHLGDYGSDAELIEKYVNVPHYVVRGNCDFSMKYPADLTVELGGARLFLAHGDRYPDVYALALKGEENHCDAVLSGHTHIPLLTAQGPLLIINPGSLSMPLGGSAASCARLDIENREIHVEMLPLK